MKQSHLMYPRGTCSDSVKYGWVYGWTGTPSFRDAMTQKEEEAEEEEKEEKKHGLS